MSLLTVEMQAALHRIALERKRQELLKEQGRFAHTAADDACADIKRLQMLMEEVGEVATALDPDAHDKDRDLLKELTQVAAISMAWMEYLLRNTTHTSDV